MCKLQSVIGRPVCMYVGHISFLRHLFVSRAGYYFEDLFLFAFEVVLYTYRRYMY